MKHLPNLLTLGNLFCGCIAIAYILSAQPYYYVDAASGMPSYNWVYGTEQMYLGTIFIYIAAICDMLDGMVARALQVFSPIGKDLDSLADIVSFGVAPAAILYKLLFDAAILENNAFEVNMIMLAPAFLLPCFAALRLAKFNISGDTQKRHFIGLPTPAAGILIACIPAILWFGPVDISRLFSKWLLHKWVVYGVIGVLCILMVSGIRFMKMLPSKWNMAHLWPRIVIILAGVIAIPFLQYAAIPVAFLLYLILSLVYKEPELDSMS